MRQEDFAALKAAVQLLEQPGFAARLTDAAGKPLDLIGGFIPVSAQCVISVASYKALQAALKFALRTMPYGPQTKANSFHKALVTVSGAASGAFGLATVAIELPLSTTIMLRSIAQIARSQGEDLELPETALECLQVFALGGPADRAQSHESGYFAVRAVLAKSITEAARFLAERGLAEQGASVLVRFITSLASRYGVVVTQKAAAQTLPAIGAIGGAGVNYVFIDHFQKVARGHFTVRRLERLYGKDVVRVEYERIAQAA
jgi:EcsC protein family